MDPLTNEDVADILALLDSLPYDEFDLETPRFRLTLRRTPAGWITSRRNTARAYRIVSSCSACFEPKCPYTPALLIPSCSASCPIVTDSRPYSPPSW